MLTLISRFSVYSVRLLCFLAAMLLFSQCGSDDEVPTPEGECPAGSIDELLDCSSIPAIVSDPVVTRSEPEVVNFDFTNNLICEQIEVNAMGAVGEYRSLNPNADVIWPGNLLQYSTISQGTPNEIAVGRAKGTITIDLLNGSTNTSKDVPEVNFSEVNGAINDIIEQNNGILAADFTYTEQRVRSKNELAVNLGVDVNSIQGGFASQMSFSSDREYNRLVVELVQKYYTVVFETPISNEEIFAPSVTPEDLVPFVGPNEAPVFIKSVTYGRQFYLLIESTSSATELEATVSANFTAGLANTELEAGVKHINELSNVNVKAFALGGDAGRALSAVTAPFDSLRVFLNKGGTITTGKAISYKMKSIIAPYQDVGVNVTTNFTINNCRPAYSRQPPAFTNAWYSVFGSEGIGAACAVNPQTSQTILINRSGTRYAQFTDSELLGIYDIGSPEDIGRLAGCPFDTISAVMSVLNDEIYAFDADGQRWSNGRPDGVWSAPRTYASAGNEPSPFVNSPAGGNGVGAVSLYTRGDGSGNKNRAIHWNRLGNKFVTYSFNDGLYSDVIDRSDYGSASGTFPFASVSAMLQVKLENSPLDSVTEGESYYQIVFDGEGKKYFFYQDGNGFSEIYDLVQPE